MKKKEQYLYVGSLDILKEIRFLLDVWGDFPESLLVI